MKSIIGLMKIQHSWTPMMKKNSEGELDALPTKFDPLNETSGKDYERTQALARIMSVERASQLLVERGLMKDIDNARDHIKEIDGDLWQSWKDSSTTTNGMILQVAAAEELGGRLYEHDGLKKNDSIRDADKEFRAIGGFNGIKAYLRGKWETTQYLLDKANIQTMKVYRGIRWTIPFMGSKEEKVKGNYSRYSDPNTFTRYPNAVILRNGCQSCTTTSGVANGWTGADNAKVYRVIAPRTAALSIPAYGINIHSEHEVVLAGVAWQAYDVWKGKAPTFEQVPLESSHMIERMRNPYYPKVDKREMPDIRPAIPYKGWTSKADEYWKKYALQGQKPAEPSKEPFKYSSPEAKQQAKDTVAVAQFKPGDIVTGKVGTEYIITKNENGKLYGKYLKDNPSGNEVYFPNPEFLKLKQDQFKVGQTVYSKYQPGKGYVITGFMKNGDLDAKEIDLKTGNPTSHAAQLVPDLIFTSKEDAKTAPETSWNKND